MKEYPIPGFSKYAANEEGDIISYQGREPRVLKQKPQKNARCRKQVKLTNDEQEMRFLIAHRVILSAKLGRPLLPWEQVRHLDSDRNNNRMDNLEPGCAILNMIDDIENGTRETSAEYIGMAIQRLQALQIRLS